MSVITLEEVERLALQLSEPEQRRLMDDLARRLRESRPKQMARDLYGDWKSKIPADFDLDAALGEIRGAWIKKLDDL